MNTLKSFIFLIFFLYGCSIYRVDSQDVTTNFYPPKNSPQDVIYLEIVDRPHEVIGYVTVNTERNKSIQRFLDKMCREAAILGGDAITDITIDAPDGWKKLPVQKLLANAYFRRNARAKVIIFK